MNGTKLLIISKKTKLREKSHANSSKHITEKHNLYSHLPDRDDIIDHLTNIINSQLTIAAQVIAIPVVRSNQEMHA